MTAPAPLPPSPLARWEDFLAALAGRRPVVFLDFDGTLAPIVERPEDAALPEATRRAVARLAGLTPVAVISGRALDDVAPRVGLPDVCYAGSHGFEIRHQPSGLAHTVGEEFLPAVEQAAERLTAELADVPGAQVEPKRFSVAVHDRRVAETDRPRVAAAVEREVARQPNLTQRGGKRVYEVRPDFDWHKGRALEWLLAELGLDTPRDVPLYLGDDETDEDAFETLQERDHGIGIAVLTEPRPTAAAWAVASPEEARLLLERLAGELEAALTGPSP